MKKSWMTGALLAGLMIITATTLAFADIPNPDNLSKSNRTSASDLKFDMQIETDEKAKEAKLIIPRAIFQQMRAQADGTSTPMAATTGRFFNMTGAQTIMSGIFLSLAFAFGGVWLVRARKGAERTARTVALTVALLLAGGGITAGVAYANAGPPVAGRSLTSKILISELQWWGASGEVRVEIVDEGDEIKLVLPRRKMTDADRQPPE